MDKEYIILESIDNNSMTTQRELSNKLGISLGSVNMLLNKMVREGLIKIEKLNTNTILYILTPKGFVEKVNKTYKYIKIHYSYITEIKEKFKRRLSELNYEGRIYIILGKDEISDLVEIALKEINKPNLMIKGSIDDLGLESCLVVVTDNELCELYKDKGYQVVNLMERI